MRCKTKPEATKLAKQPTLILPANIPKSLQIELLASGQANLPEFNTLALNRILSNFIFSEIRNKCQCKIDNRSG